MTFADSLINIFVPIYLYQLNYPIYSIIFFYFLVSLSFVIFSYPGAKIVSKIGVKSEKDYDVSPEEERELCRLIKEETGHDFVFLTDYPIEARPFYHMRYADRPGITMSYDLLYKGVEITTGAQREHRPDILEKQAKEKNMPMEELKDYLNFFRYGCPPHGGAGIGPGRIIMKMLAYRGIATFRSDHDRPTDRQGPCRCLFRLYPYFEGV